MKINYVLNDNNNNKIPQIQKNYFERYYVFCKEHNINADRSKHKLLDNLVKIGDVYFIFHSIKDIPKFKDWWKNNKIPIKYRIASFLFCNDDEVFVLREIVDRFKEIPFFTIKTYLPLFRSVKVGNNFYYGSKKAINKLINLLKNKGADFNILRNEDQKISIKFFGRNKKRSFEITY